MKQIVILFVLILLATASSDLLKSISKFADDGDNPSKFAKSKVSPFSEEESEDYDNDDADTSKKVAQQDDDDEEVDVMAQLKSYQQKLSTNKEVKPPQPQKKQVQVISESESEYDDEDDSGNMWSRGISKKLAQTESKPLVLQLIYKLNKFSLIFIKLMIQWIFEYNNTNFFFCTNLNSQRINKE